VAYPSGPATYSAIAELVLILQDELDTAWTLDTMANRAGFAPHHLAHAFRQHVGAPPLAYLRRLRLERAAHQLAAQSELALDEIATAAGYASAAAFHRAFTRLFRRSPSEVRRMGHSIRGIGRAPRQHTQPDLPPTLGTPEIVEVPALHGRSLRVASAEVTALATAWTQFLSLTPVPASPWQRGIASPPQGWATRSATREFRCVALGEPAIAVAPLEPWRMRRCWAVRFPFEGNSWEIPAAFEWIFHRWLPPSGLRYAFDPTLTLFDEVTTTVRPGAQVTARICVPIERLASTRRRTRPSQR
jgi:AraC-like DNA-binding protein